MKVRAVPDYSRVDGFIKLTFLKRTDSKYAYFDLITFWKNMEVIKGFAGDDFEKAKYYPDSFWMKNWNMPNNLQQTFG